MDRSDQGYEDGPETYCSDDYMRMLKEALIQDRLKTPIRSRDKSVAVIGAGMSGLVAGWLLKKDGFKVSIFEASNIVGGRIKTLRDRFTSGLYAEAGAMRIPKCHPLTNHLIQQLFPNPKQTFEFNSSSEQSYIHFNNVIETVEDYKRSKNDFRFRLNKDETVYSASRLFEICLSNYVNETSCLKDIFKDRNFTFKGMATDLTQAERRKLLKELDRFSLRQFLLEKAFIRAGQKDEDRLSPGGADYITALLVYEMHLSSSMAAILGDVFEVHVEEQFRQLSGGMDNLPQAFNGLTGKRGIITNTFSDEIYYNSRVTEIRRMNPDDKRSRLWVVAENPITHRRMRKDFDLIVIAMPFSALRHVRTKDLMTPEKRRAVRQLHYDNSCKILLEFKEMFWSNKTKVRRAPIVGGSSITDLPLRQIHYPSIEQYSNANGRGILLASYTWGEDSLRWTSLKSDDRIRFALRDLKRVHEKDDEWYRIEKKLPGGLESLCVSGMSHSWAEHEFTSGAFAMFEPYQLSKLFKDIWRPEGRIHYCGEHTSERHGWIEGAIESAFRVWKEIMKRIDADPNLSWTG